MSAGVAKEVAKNLQDSELRSWKTYGCRDKDAGREGIGSVWHLGDLPAGHGRLVVEEPFSCGNGGDADDLPVWRDRDACEAGAHNHLHTIKD